MKKTTILILTALALLSASGCNKENQTQTEITDKSSNISAEADSKDDDSSESDAKKPTNKKIDATAPKKDSYLNDKDDDDNNSTDDNDDTYDGGNDYNNGSYDGNYDNDVNAVIEPDDTGYAYEIYQNAVSMYESVLYRCPFDLDYDSETSDGMVAINDPNISSVDDVAEYYCNVFSEPDSYIYDRYSESDGTVYYRDAGKGRNIYYSGTDLEYISGDGERMTYNAVSHYKNPDTGESKEDETASFTIVKTENGYKVEEFDYPR